MRAFLIRLILNSSTSVVTQVHDLFYLYSYRLVLLSCTTFRKPGLEGFLSFSPSLLPIPPLLFLLASEYIFS